jgi:predicted O-methyltransferase YrrM
VDPRLLDIARAAPGFMPDDEGLALHAAGLRAARHGPLLEIGTYCGKSAVYLGAAAQARGSVLFTIDHHRGSEEHQPGQSYHDPLFVDGTGRVDTFPAFRATIARAGLEDNVVALVGESHAISAHWSTRLALVFIDGSHSRAAAHRDYEDWAPRVVPGGLLVVHDVFEDPSQGGRPPFEIYRRAVESGSFVETEGCRSLRVLRRSAPNTAS